MSFFSIIFIEKWADFGNFSHCIISVSTVSVRRRSAGLPPRPGLLSGGKLLSNPPQHAPADPGDLRVCRRTVRLRGVRYDPLLPSLRVAKEGLLYVRPEGLPRQTPL